MSVSYHTTPHYIKEAEADRHFKAMREQVSQLMRSLPGSRKYIIRFKAFLLPVLFFGTYNIALFQTSYLLFCVAYILLGLMLVIIFLNLIHEASHNNLFRGRKHNRRFMMLFDMIGANSYMWNKRHVILHHNYTNVEGWDSDIEKSKFLKVHPLDSKKSVPHYHHLLIFLYPLFITNWFLLRDFKDFFNPNMIVRKLGTPPRIEYLKLFFFKFLFLGYLVIIPALLTPFHWWQAALALFMMLLSAGLFALMVLLPPHVNTSNQFPIVSGDMKLQQSWFMHQLNTTNDVTTSNWFTRYVMANCNFHLAHHLFPNISHVYAKEVTDTIRKYAQREGLNYRAYPLFNTFRNHYRLIRSNGRWMDILEEDM